jgi:hypothetical protein
MPLQVGLPYSFFASALTAEQRMGFQVVPFPPLFNDEGRTPLLSMKEGSLSTEEVEDKSRKVLQEADIKFLEVLDIFKNIDLSLVEHPIDIWSPNSRAEKLQ